MSIEELNPADFKRGVLPQREKTVGQKRLRDPKPVKLEYRHFPDEEWQLWSKFHTVEDAMKARKNLRAGNRAAFGETTATQWRVDGVEVK